MHQGGFPYWMIFYILITCMLDIALLLRKRNRSLITPVTSQSKQRDDRTDQEESVDASSHMRHSVAIPYPTPQKNLTMQVTRLLLNIRTSCRIIITSRMKVQCCRVTYGITLLLLTFFSFFLSLVQIKGSGAESALTLDLDNNLASQGKVFVCNHPSKLHFVDTSVALAQFSRH